MEYNRYFSLIIIISSISGILLGVFTNNISDSNEISKDTKYSMSESDKNIETKVEDKNEKEKENNIDTTKENEKGKEIKEEEEETDGKNKEEEKKEKNENNKQKNENEKDNIYTSDVLKGIISNLDGYIDKIINERFQINNEKLVSLKELYEKKFEMIEEDILAQKKENDKLEKSLDELLYKISELKEPNIERKDSLGSENSVEKGLNSLKNINEMFKTPSSAPKNEINNANFPPFIKQLNSMRMIYPLNFFGNENMFNNPMMMNNPRIMQIMNNSFMNQANNLFQKKK
jgi:flagellar biosynthesis GTPase FlhF